MQIEFIPELHTPEQVAAAHGYQQLWSQHGNVIIQAYEQVAGFDFPIKQSQAIIHDDISQSHPLKFQAQVGEREMLGDLIHELGHIVIVNGPTKRLDSPDDNDTVRAHKALDLILYEVMIRVMGKEFADWEVAREKAFTPSYRQAWEWALAMSQEERQNMFASLLERY